MLRLFSFCLLCFASNAFAGSWDLINPPLTSPFYVGAGVGYGQIDGDYVDPEWQGNWQLYGGYRFDGVWAVEFGAGRNGDVVGVTDSLPSEAITHNYGASVSLLGFAYYSDFAAFYRLGVQLDDYDLSREQDSLDDGCSLQDDDSALCLSSNLQLSYLVGLGGEFPITDQVVTRLEWVSQFGGENFNQHQAVLSVMLKF